MALSAKKKIILIKLQPTPGVDSSPTGVNAIQTANLTINPLAGSTVTQEVDGASMGSDAKIHVGQHITVEFDFYLAGSGTAGDAPAWGVIARIGAHSETVTASTKVDYAPISESFEMATSYVHFDGTKHVLLDLQGNVTFKLDANGLPMGHFSGKGLYSDPIDAADPTPDFSGWKKPIPVTNKNTLTSTLHGSTVALRNFNLDAGVQVELISVPGQEEIATVDRGATGAATFNRVTVAEKAFVKLANDNTTGAMNIVHGVTAGNIIDFSAPNVQISEPSYGDDQSVSTISLNLAFLPATGDDDYLISVR